MNRMHGTRMRFRDFSFALLAALVGACSLGAKSPTQSGSRVVKLSDPVLSYKDGRPRAGYRLNALDQGVVLRHGDGPGKCDYLGARDIWVFESGGTYYMHYDAAGPAGWLAALATSKDLVHWVKQGPALELGKPGDDDSEERFLRCDLQGRQDLAHVLPGHAKRLTCARSGPDVPVPDDEGQELITFRPMDQTTGGSALPLPPRDVLFRDRQPGLHRQTWRRIPDVL